VLEPNTEQSHPEIGTLKYDGAPQNPKAFVPLNFNGLSLRSQTKPSGLGDRLLRGFEALTAFQSKAPEAPPEAPSGNMGVIRYSLSSPIQTYRMQRQRRYARFQIYGRPLMIVACLALAVPVGMTWTGNLGAGTPVARASVPATEPIGAAESGMPAAALPTSEPELVASPVHARPQAEVAPPATAKKRVVTVKAGDTLSGIAKLGGLTVRELASLNGLKDLHSLKIGQEILLPAAAAPNVAAFAPPAQPLVLALAPETPALSDDAAQSPANQAPPKPAVKLAADPAAYTIRSGDTLSMISSRFGIKIATLASANDLTEKDTLAVGKTLKVPHADGIYVKVRSGESLSVLAARYGVKASDIQAANQIADPRNLREGQVLFLPGVEPRLARRDARRERGDFKQASRGLIGDLGRAVGKKFIWPTAGQVTSYFGEREGRQHSGVDIPRPKGSPIHAAKSGTVVAAGWNGDYGKTVDISHGNGVVTRYAHCSKIAVKPGDAVAKGELIGLVGETGRATGPHLHYEVRIGGRPVNPSKFHN